MTHTDEFKKVLEDIKNQANEFNKPHTHNHEGENGNGHRTTSSNVKNVKRCEN